MKAGKYTYKELFVNRYVSQLVVPEIQRDYVWQQEQLFGLLDSIFDDFKDYVEAEIPELNLKHSVVRSINLQEDFSEFYRKRNFSANIGFIYAYSDEQYSGRYFLIDGQQRITTIYLLLLVLASRTSQISDFYKNYCRNKLPILDYRIRESAQNFLHQLVPYVLDHGTKDIKQQTWYLNAYDHDVTISNALSNIYSIESWLTEKDNPDSGLGLLSFYGYVQNYTEFWYFDTNISAQGENLYIYLNARGEQMQGNENLKADLLSKLQLDDDKNLWGKKWEEWQDYFWQKRGAGSTNNNTSNPNADEGFNQFLACIAALTRYLSNDISNILDKDKKVSPSLLSNILSLELIERYIDALKFLDENKRSYSENYTYSVWLDKCINELWKLLNFTNTSWFINYSDSKFSTETNHMVFMWGILHWVSSAQAHGETIAQEIIYKGVRQFYLRLKNNVRSVKNISSSVSNLLETGFISNDAKAEEYIKERWLAKQSSNLSELESLIWEIEDHPYNLDGSDVGLINISHLINFDDELSIDKLKKVKERFFDCFPHHTRSHNLIQSLLLYYGVFWEKKSPWYYGNYHFGNWRKIIRKQEVDSSNYTFRLLLNDLITTGESHEQLLQEKRETYVEPAKPNGLLEQFLWYNNFIGEKMWNQGNYIAVGDNYAGYDEVFSPMDIFYNTKGDFRGGFPARLSKLLPEEIRRSVIKGA
ncbi:MAG: hypothetical protein ACJAS1_003319 [Oleiphilaceae bacterium]|jgi:uncharacterized protein with ParB-like and HNH nuclease domain